MYRQDTTPRPVVWLTCADLYLGDVRGCLRHDPSNLGEHDCWCSDHIRWSASECARPEVRMIVESRFGLRLCCACAHYFELAVMRSAGYSRDPHLFHRLPLAERQAHLRRFVARLVWKVWHTEGYVGTWRSWFPAQAKAWRERLAVERAEVAA